MQQTFQPIFFYNCLVWPYYLQWRLVNIFLQNLSGTIIAVINVVSVWLSPNPRTAAIYYFITALFILLACFDSYFALPLNVGYEIFQEEKLIDCVAEVLPLPRTHAPEGSERPTQGCDLRYSICDNIQTLLSSAVEYFHHICHYSLYFSSCSFR